MIDKRIFVKVYANTVTTQFFDDTIAVLLDKWFDNFANAII